MLQITSKTSAKKITDYIAGLREQKGKEKETLSIIEKASGYANDLVVNLYWEKALSYQHLVMNEDAKGENADARARSQYLAKMEEAVKHAGYFIVRFDQEWWKHRLYRFLGRVCDYKADYKRAINYYRRSLKETKNDPEYLEYRYPRHLEVRGFLSASIIMSGKDAGKGYTLAKETFSRFDTDKDALILKKNDPQTWAIWKSGIPIRTINALLDRKITFDKKEAIKWISEAQEIIKKGKNLEYRKEEIQALLKRLKEVN